MIDSPQAPHVAHVLMHYESIGEGSVQQEKVDSVPPLLCENLGGVAPTQLVLRIHTLHVLGVFMLY